MAGESQLQRACRLGDMYQVQLLVGEGASLGGTSCEGRAWFTPLHIAALHGHLKLAKWLLGAKADLEQLDYRGRTPAEVAVETGHEQFVEWIIQVQNKNDFLIHRAVQSGQSGIVRCLIRAEVAGANDPNADGRTAFYLSCQCGPLELCKWLHNEADADSNTTDNENWGCLHVAAHYGQLEVIEWLLDINPDLLRARAKGPMIENGTRVYLGDLTALHLAARKNYGAVFELLKVHCKKHGSSLNELIDMQGKSHRLPCCTLSS